MQNDRMDLISDVLRAVQLSGAIFFDVHAHAPWVSEAPAAQSLLPMVMPDAQSLIEYHVIVRGSGWAALAEGDDLACPPVHFGPGSVIIFPHGDAHRMASDRTLRGELRLDTFSPPAPEARLPFALTVGDGSSVHDGEEVELICGFLGHDSRLFNPIIESLPRLLHVQAATDLDGDALPGLIATTVTESRSRRIGGQAVLARLSELIFIEALRRYAEMLPADAVGWLVAARAPGVGQVLSLMHDRPEQHWTVGALAREVGMSRTVLAERFAEVVGRPPMSYLAQWRMQLAARMITAGGRSVQEIAEAVGYESEASLSRGFKRATGMRPGQWRRASKESREAAARSLSR